VQRWPYPGAVDIIERDGDWVQAHRVHNWCYLGSHTRQGQPPDAALAAAAPAPTGAAHAHIPISASASASVSVSAAAAAAAATSATSARFDLDTYKILVTPLISGSADVQALG